MTLLLSRSDLQEALSMQDAVELVERAFVGQEGQRAVSKRVLQVWAPGVVEELAEGSHCLRANPVYQSRIVPVGALKETEGKGLVYVGRVKKDDVIGLSRGHAQ